MGFIPQQGRLAMGLGHWPGALLKAGNLAAGQFFPHGFDMFRRHDDQQGRHDKNSELENRVSEPEHGVEGKGG
ncbi:hypothetical protein D3C73_1202490 [compost metagenome]